MPLRFTLLFFLISLLWQTAVCQDSLADKTFHELDDLSVKAFQKGDIELSRIYSKYQIARAKQEKDSVRIAFAFYTYMFDEDLSLALKYCDSAIYYTQNSDHKSHPTYGYLVKSRRLLEAGRFDESMKDLVIAFEYAKKKNNIRHISSAKQKMAIIKSFIGNYHEALELYREDYIYTIENDTSVNREENLINAIHNLSIIFLKSKMLDSARFYSKLGLNKAEFESIWHYRFLSVNAEVEYYSGNFGSAFDTLIKYKNNYKGNSLANKYYYIGKIYNVRNNIEMAEKYFLKVDSIVVKDNAPFMEVKDVYQTLAEFYKMQNNDSLQINYINKYIWADSILSHQRTQINPLMELKFDNPRMLEEKQRLIEKAENNKKWIYIISVLALLLVILGARLYFGQTKLKRKLKVLLEEGVHLKTPNNIARSNIELIVPQNIAVDIRRKLEDFENSELVKNSSLNQRMLATEMGTNTRYLSNYINHFKGANFPSYLKELRIRIAVDRLKIEPELLKYSIKGLASEFGFVTARAFSRAFVEQTGIKPSQFLNELTKN